MPCGITHHLIYWQPPHKVFQTRLVCGGHCVSRIISAKTSKEHPTWDSQHIDLCSLIWIKFEVSIFLTDGKNIGSGNGLVMSGNKSLPEPMMTQIYVISGPYLLALPESEWTFICATTKVLLHKQIFLRTISHRIFCTRKRFLWRFKLEHCDIHWNTAEENFVTAVDEDAVREASP